MKKILMLLLMSSMTFLMANNRYELLNESFEGSFPPPEWTLQTTSNGFTQNSARPNTGSYSMAHLKTSIQSDDWIITPLISIPFADSVKVSFWENVNNASSANVHEFCISSDMVNWEPLYSDIPSESTYEQVVLSINPYMGLDVYFGWRYNAYKADDWYIDDVAITTYEAFTDIYANLEGVEDASVAWGDYDNDGDLDILLTGQISSGDCISKVYMNDSGNFTDINAGLTGVYYSSVDWGDYDNDGDLDILLTGYIGDSERISKIYNNDSGVFTDIEAGLTNVSHGSVAWGDYDNDGDLDILLTGYDTNSNRISKIYNNDSGVFTDIDAGLEGVYTGSVAWGDYDNDGDLDILLTGGSSGGRISKVYMNDSGIFTDINAGLQGVGESSVAWGDYDNDGDLDILLTGVYYDTSFKHTSRIYNNDSSVFTDIEAGLTNVAYSSAEWGDYDNDGDLDVLLTGNNKDEGEGIISKIYSNDSGVFTDIEAGLTDVNNGSVAWGDYDNDGDLDILLTGSYFSGLTVLISKIYRNNTSNINNTPTNPSRLICEIENEVLELSWDPSSDIQTPQIALSYNVELQINGEVENSVMSDINNGYRKVVQSGNASENTFYKINNFYNLPQEEKTLSYKVQAIDNSFAGSEFVSSIEYTFVSPRDLLLLSNNEMVETDKLKWEYIYPAFVDYYIVQVDDDPNFGSPLEESVPLSKTLYIGIALNELSQFASLVNNTTYYWRIKPVYLGTNKITAFSETPKSFTYTSLLPPSGVIISDDGSNVNLTWDATKLNAKGVVYTVYSSEDPEAVFPTGWTAVGLQLPTNSWSELHSATKKFYRVTVGSSSK